MNVSQSTFALLLLGVLTSASLAQPGAGYPAPGMMGGPMPVQAGGYPAPGYPTQAYPAQAYPAPNYPAQGMISPDALSGTGPILSAPAGCDGCATGACGGHGHRGHHGRGRHGGLRGYLNRVFDMHHWAATTSGVGGTWYAFGDVLIMARNIDSDVVLGTTADTGATLLTADDLDVGMEAGARATIGYIRPHGPGMEFEYFGVYDWDDHIQLEDEAGSNLSLPGDLALASFDYQFASEIDYTYDSRLNSFELNYVKPYGSLMLLAGLRHVSLDEDFNIESTSGLFGTTSDYFVETTNDLYGGQLGLRGYYNIYNVGFSIWGKGGLFVNANSQFTEVLDLGNTIRLREVYEDSGSFSALGETGVTAQIPLGSTFKLRAGYNFLVVTGLALAPNQLDFTFEPESSEFVEDDGVLIAHGMNFGLEAKW